MRLAPVEQTNCMHQLKGYIDQLRALTPPFSDGAQAVDGGGGALFRIIWKDGKIASIIDWECAWLLE